MNQRRRPRQARSRATWEVIVEAAAQVLERRGLAGFNTNAVAERAGVSVGSVYRYFSDKHAILAAAAREAFGREDGARRKLLLEALIAVVEAVGRLGDRGRPPVGAALRIEGRTQAVRVRRRPRAGTDALERAMRWLAELLVLKAPQPIPLRITVRAPLNTRRRG
ncbi:MAG TPA: helix-turn-helix domain-containing protein [Caulobacteraceae bacterium]|jgi:AcrR family transcriptional regulator